MYIDNNDAYLSDVILIPQGPQFQAKGGILAAFICISSLLYFIVLLINGIFFISFLLLFLAIILFIYFIDVRGIQFNSKKHIVRQYKSYLWFKFGTWDKISNYNLIHLVHSNSKGINNSLFTYSTPPTYHFYKIYLESEEENKSIFLAEYKNYHNAERICKNVARATGLKLKIF